MGPFLKTKDSKIYACVSPYIQFLDLAIDPMVKDPCVTNNIVQFYLNIISYSSFLTNIIYTSKHNSICNMYLQKNSVIQVSYCFPFSQISVILWHTSLNCFFSLFSETQSIIIMQIHMQHVLTYQEKRTENTYEPMLNEKTKTHSTMLCSSILNHPPPTALIVPGSCTLMLPDTTSVLYFNTVSIKTFPC